mgnify:CR=1 FL=1
MPLRSSLVVASLSVVHGMRLPWTDLSSLREYEKKHGRVAIVSLASLGALSAEGVEAPVSWLSNRPVDEQLCFFAGAAIVEAAATLPRFEGLLSLRGGGADLRSRMTIPADTRKKPYTALLCGLQLRHSEPWYVRDRAARARPRAWSTAPRATREE